MPLNFPEQLDIESLSTQLPLPVWSRSPGASPLDLTIHPPGSKSITNRALLLAALCKGTSNLNHALLDADDAARMIDAITQLGAVVDQSNPETVRITGTGARWEINSSNSTLDLNNAGTATRFLTASALLANAPLTITGNDRMQQRPIKELANLLESLGASIEYLNNHGCPPLRITPPNKLSTNQLTIGPTQSSQFITALMLVAVYLEDGLTISMPEGTTSASYVRMTLDLLDQLGVKVQHSDDLSIIRVHPGLDSFNLDIEPDASGATYWWAAGALVPKATIRVQGFDLNNHSSQGDAQFPHLLEQMGCNLITKKNTLACKGNSSLNPIICDMRDMPDAVMSLAAIACFTKGTTIIKGVKTLRVKECDRIDALQSQLGKLSVFVETKINGDDDVISITPPNSGVDCSPSCEPITFETYNDHRMAMSLSLIALRRPNITIDNPKCVDKTYPTFWTQFAKLYE
ncbi:MAG: 3-phosphoshikimate 1-carboxyvinyltransferase [Phycisphaerales bacterium]|nr:3-phosphoshikimate 1-carboxyvinyltransferase [Phycisphaerales bacterium]